MNIYITGINGTLGKPLAKHLREQGHNVSGCDLTHCDDPSVDRVDIADYRQLYKSISSRYPVVVFHFAAEFGRKNGEDFYEQVWRTNAIGTKNLLEIQKRCIFRLIHASSSEVYGELNLPDEEFIAESMTDDRYVLPRNDYAISKWCNELQIRNAWREDKSDTMVLRFCNSYGPGEYFTPYRSVVCQFVHKAIHGMPWKVYTGHNRVFMYIDDFIETLGRCVTMMKPGVTVNIAGVEYRSVKELSDLVIKETGCDPRLAELLPVESSNVLNKHPDIKLARELFKHNPKTSLEDGIEKTVDWMRSL